MNWINNHSMIQQEEFYELLKDIGVLDQESGSTLVGNKVALEKLCGVIQVNDINDIVRAVIHQREYNTNAMVKICNFITGILND